MIGKLVIRSFRALGVVVASVVDRLVVPTLLRLHGVSIGAGCRFNGMPVVRIVPGGELVIGDRVLIISRQYANTATLPYRTMLSVTSPGATLLLGEGVGLSGVSIVATTRVEIGDRTLVGSGAVIWDTDFHPLDPAKRRIHATKGAVSAPIRIGSDVFIGARSILLKGITIGDSSVIAAGSVVVSDVPRGVIAGGNPARVIRDL